MNRRDRRRMTSKYGALPAGKSTTNQSEIESWPKDIAMFGIDLAGSDSFVLVTTDAALSAFAAIYGELPRTLTTRFPDGHLELLFRGVRGAGEIEEGVDIITDWTVAPGSKVDGKPVVFEFDAPVALAPAWLLSLPAQPGHDQEIQD